MKIHEIPVPFQEFSFGEDCGWLPGCRKGFEFEEPDNHIPTYEADSMGHMIINEIQTVNIEGYEDRVFYTRQWRDPDGKVFGKKDLRVKGSRAFARLLKGWRHSFYLDGELVNEKSMQDL